MTSASRPPNGRIADKIVLSLRILLAVLLIFAGSKKLLNDPAMLLLFQQIGLGYSFQPFTGLVEVAAGMCLLVSATAFHGAFLATACMAGAVLVNAFIPGIEHAMPKLVLALSLLVAYGGLTWRLRPQALRRRSPLRQPPR